MGLNQYWFVDKRTKEQKLEDVITNTKPEFNEIGYHRKFWDLQKFIDSDNWETIHVEEQMLADLKIWCNDEFTEFKELNSEDQYEYVLSVYESLFEILEQIEECLANGHTVYYQADW